MMTQEMMNNITTYMDDGIREKLHNELVPCEPDEFLKEYIKLDPEMSDLLVSEFKGIYQDH